MRLIKASILCAVLLVLASHVQIILRVGLIFSLEDFWGQSKDCPVNVVTDSTDPVDTCISFLGSLIKKIQSLDLRLDTMNTLVQTIINASVSDIQRAKR